MTIFLLLSLVLVLSAENMAAPTVSYVELRLALQLPTAFCNTGTTTCFRQIYPLLTLHGLWPNSQKVFQCPPLPPQASFENLYRQVRRDVQTDLRKYWPNLDSRFPRDSLWKYEYETHGYCFREFPNPEIYLGTALSIAKHILHYIRLRPGLHRVKDFRQVTIAGRKLILGLRCNYARQSKIPQLLEIVICINSNNHLKDCTNYVDKCNNQWWDSNIRAVRKGWFVVPYAPASLSGSYRSTP